MSKRSTSLSVARICPLRWVQTTQRFFAGTAGSICQPSKIDRKELTIWYGQGHLRSSNEDGLPDLSMNSSRRVQSRCRISYRPSHLSYMAAHTKDWSFATTSWRLMVCIAIYPIRFICYVLTTLLPFSSSEQASWSPFPKRAFPSRSLP